MTNTLDTSVLAGIFHAHDVILAVVTVPACGTFTFVPVDQVYTLGPVETGVTLALFHIDVAMVTHKSCNDTEKI